MFIKKRYNKNNELISCRLICSGKDPLTYKHKNYTKTWKVPKNLTKKEFEHELKKIEVEFEKEVLDLSNGIIQKKEHVFFKDFAKMWLEGILARNEKSFNYYNRAKDDLNVIIPYFQNYQLQQINAMMIQKFYDYLGVRTYIKEKVIVKKSLRDYVINLGLKQGEFASQLGINRLTLRTAQSVGANISIKVARNISRELNVPLSTYFDIQKVECKYAKATNESIKTTLVMLLNSARRMGLIEVNYATKDFTTCAGGTIKEKEVYDMDEAKEFYACVTKEKDIRIKTVLSILLLMGMRRCEVAGLCWKDVDFQHKELSIRRNSLYVTGFGVVEKGTKTINSRRQLLIPDALCSTLQEYRDWWLEQQGLRGDLWASAERLFLQEDGEPINPCTITKWVEKFERDNGLKHVSTHALRHTNASLLNACGVDIKVISQRLGHASTFLTLDTYTHGFKESDRQACSALEKVLN